MTRHTYRPGGAIDPGATYYPMDGARQGDPLEPDDVIAALDAMAQEIENLRAELDGRAPVTNNPNDPNMKREGFTLPCGGMTVNYVGSGAGHTVKPNTVYDSSAEHWSPWLEWRGGPCPLPEDVIVEYRTADGGFGHFCASRLLWRRESNAISSFRYCTTDPAGWLPRGDWIPPAELWDDGCPVRVEFAEQKGDKFECGIPRGSGTHIRLVARHPQAELPEGWWITHIGHLVQPNGYVALTHDVVSRYGPDAIRQAVDAWLRGDGR